MLSHTRARTHMHTQGRSRGAAEGAAALIWVKCEKCTNKMVEATKKHKKGFFAQLKLVHTKYHRKEDFFENKYFIPSVFTIKDGKKVYGMMHCSNTNVGRPMWNEHGFTGVTDNTVIVMDRNYHFGHLHRMGIPSIAKQLGDEEE